MTHKLSRRDMLKGTAAGAAGLVAGLTPFPGARAGHGDAAFSSEHNALDAGD